MSEDGGFRRWLTPAAGIVLSLVATILFAGVQQRAQRGQFNTACDNRALVIQREIESNITLLKALAAYASSSPDRNWLSMHQFVANFTPLGQDITRYYWWNASILPGVAQPLESYPLDSSRIIFEKEAIQRVIAVAARTGSEAAVVLPGPRKLCLIGIAINRKTGQARAGQVGGAEGVLLAFDVGDLVEDSLTVLSPSGIHLAVRDQTGTALHLHISRRLNAALPFSAVFQPSPVSWARTLNVSFAGTRWSVVFTPINDYLSPLSVAICWGVFFSSLLMTLLVDNLLERRRRQSSAARELAGLRESQLAETRGWLEVEKERKRSAEASLRRSEERFRNAYMDAVIGVMMADATGTLTLVNRSFCLMSGYTEEELIGRKIPDLLVEGDRAESHAQTQELLSGAVPNYVAIRQMLRKDGALVWLRASVSLVEEDERRGLIALLEDLSGEMEARKKLEFHATHDVLTGLCNRRAFEEKLTRAVEQAARSGSGLTLMYVDLDGFKFVNDSLGHTIGDRLLPAVAGRLSRCLDRNGTLARVGGDEFTIILEGEAAAESVASRLLAELKDPFFIEDHELFVSASIGICRCPEDAEDAVTLVQYADAAMYAAKREGRGCFCFFTKDMAGTAIARLTMERDLRRAQERGELEVHFQPLLSGEGRSIVSLEALCRWHHPVTGSVRPDVFIPVAEETGLIVPIGRWVLQQACREAVEWNRISAFPIKVAVNVSVVQLAQGSFARDVAEVLEETGLPSCLLELEITESALMQNSDAASRVLGQLRELGISIAIDDFGTGYSSLSRLRRLPLDTLKIDRSFIRDLTEAGSSRQLVASLVALAHGMGLQVVTEGVERYEQAQALTQLGCDILQGFFFSKPLNAAAARGFIRKAAAPEQQSLARLSEAVGPREDSANVESNQTLETLGETADISVQEQLL